MMSACHAGDPGSIPGECTLFLLFAHTLGVHLVLSSAFAPSAFPPDLPSLFLINRLVYSNSFFQMPRMPEIKSVPENFVELPQEKIDAVPYKDKKREKARKVKLAQAKIEEQQKKEERERLKKEKYEQDQINRLRNQEMKKRKLDDLYDDEDDEEEMRREARLLKKLKRGEITEEEFEFAVGEKDMEAEFDGTGENEDPENEDGNDEADPMEQDPVEDNEEVSNDDGAAQATNKNKKKKKKKKKAKSKPIM
jgi:hypothetical protein